MNDKEISTKNRELFFWEKETLDTLLAHGAITQAEHERSMRVLVEKMGLGGKNELYATLTSPIRRVKIYTTG